MARHTQLYSIADPGGLAGADGVKPVETLLLVGEADRMWLEGRSFDVHHGPLGRVTAMVPAESQTQDVLLDSRLAFHPDRFRAGPTFATTAEQRGDNAQLDFSRWTAIPPAQPQLREDAHANFSHQRFWQADLAALTLGRELPCE